MSLGHAGVEGINDILTVATAPRILADSVSLLGGPLAEQIVKAAADVISEHFEDYEVDELRWGTQWFSPDFNGFHLFSNGFHLFSNGFRWFSNGF